MRSYLASWLPVPEGECSVAWRESQWPWSRSLERQRPVRQMMASINLIGGIMWKIGLIYFYSTISHHRICSHRSSWQTCRSKNSPQRYDHCTWDDWFYRCRVQWKNIQRSRREGRDGWILFGRVLHHLQVRLYDTHFSAASLLYLLVAGNWWNTVSVFCVYEYLHLSRR